MKTEALRCDVLVVGSGPSGATTACLLAEAGKDVILAEEGAHLRLESAPSYSLEEMNQKYRNAGLTPAFGPTKVTYIEGRCVGGSSEINAALFHRPIPEVLLEWQVKYQVDRLLIDDLEPWLADTERDLSVSAQLEGVAPASRRLAAAADSLGWTQAEVRRFWKYTRDARGRTVGRRQSMTETMVPRFEAAGGRLLAESRARRLELDGKRARRAILARRDENGRRFEQAVEFREVVVCAGAVQTPALLRRSGITRNVGDSLRMHPMIRVAAIFDDEVNEPSYGVPVHQVEQFKPHMTLGCSHSSLPHLALWLAGEVDDKRARLERWRRMAVFYAAVTGSAAGKVRSLPWFEEPLVTYPLNAADLSLLGEGIYRLGQLVFAAGAKEIVSPVEGGPTLRSVDDVRPLRTGLQHKQVNITAIHLFSSCPMGEDRRRCAVDSWGKLHELDNLYVFDASTLPDTPGVNPQGTIIAIARRNTARMLGRV